ncbi:unnamed protein product [Phytophthora fragariaefolia]|uniref:Unnamed protein product n=1 Tax=Phytophthora fragariaefolia TaxID=1490495 RepID=A0A9W6TKE8_9STRA|nr:unnamed protein product [Phytophthora fragariaefolia]
MAEALTDSYITLTPTAAAAADCQRGSHSAPASDLLARKWAAAAKRKASMEVLKVLEPEPEDDTDRDSSRTETDRSSEIGADEAVSSEGDDVSSSSRVDVESDDEKEDEDEEEQQQQEEGVIPTYVCELHDPKPVLVAEQIPYNRVDIKPCETSSAHQGASELLLFRYEISVGRAQQSFECSPSRALEVFKKLLRDKKCAGQLRFIEMNCLKDGLIGSLKRMYASPAQISTEVRDVLEAISDVDAVLMSPAYLYLVGASKGSTLCREIERLLQSHSKTPESDALCMCDTYYKSVQRYGEFFHEQAQTANRVRQSTVASESLMRARGVLTYYTETIYLLDKREFRPMHGLKRCNVYGFGRRKLFEIVRVSRKQWSLRHVNYGEIFTLSLKKYAGGVHHMVAVKRMVPDVQNGGLRHENVCFVKKSKSQGYRCLLMSEVISQGKVTTSISLQKPRSPPGDPNFHYMTMSEVSGPSRASICSSTLSVPCERYKHVQRLNVSGGSDVVTYIAVAASYDILVGALSYWMERNSSSDTMASAQLIAEMETKYPNLSVLRYRALAPLQIKLRDERTTPTEFKLYADRLMRLLAEEGLAACASKTQTVVTPTGDSFTGLVPAEKVCAVSIIRAGDSLLQSIIECDPTVSVGKILIQRDEKSEDKHPVMFYSKLPPNVHALDNVLLVDPMLATGGSVNMAIKVSGLRCDGVETVVMSLS